MTNLAHWQDDIDDALGGDFDGSLSGLCIMSLSFDFTKNGANSHMGVNNNNKDNNNSLSSYNNLQASGQSSASALTKPFNVANNIDHESSSVNCFKRFKAHAESSDSSVENDINRTSNHSKTTSRLLQSHSKNCSSISAPGGSTSTNYCQSESTGEQDNDKVTADSDPARLSPHSSCERTSALSTSDESSRQSFTRDVSLSPSPFQSSSISSNSRASSRSHSPSDMSLHGGGAGSGKITNGGGGGGVHNNSDSRVNLLPDQANLNRSSGHHDTRVASVQENQQVSLYSVKDSLFNGGTLKESSYTTSVITTTAPIHFKNMHHPFSLKQFPPSPYHQFSNSSLNHDFYDRYMSYDSHQPLQTPLIGIERTQDLLSLKLPPHGPDDADSQRFPKDWSFGDDLKDGDSKRNNGTPDKHDDRPVHSNNPQGKSNKTTSDQNRVATNQEKGFPFNYKSNQEPKVQPEPIDLNMSFNDQENCDDEEEKDNMFNESMKHFNQTRVNQESSFDLRSKIGNSSDEIDGHQVNDQGSVSHVAHQYHGQESMFGVDPGKQKFQYVLAAPISVATKLDEYTMTYLNQAQAYEIKLENTTDVAEAKKGFMCSIINIGFQERHMQQAEHELWQQWSHQHPNEKIFSVDMKLSYNVFGVESDGLNKYEFLWDSSKAAGVFIRINSISTEFTAKKHGGEKGVPFKLSIETFSYNSKTHDSYFISAACCQIKVFKPKGAERKIRSDRDKISKKPMAEQEKYHRSCDNTIFRECSLTSLHPMADLGYYRHSHGHFASKQVISAISAGASTSSISAHHQQPGDALDQCNSSQQDKSPEHQPSEHNQSSQINHDNNESSSNEQNSSNQREFNNQSVRTPGLLSIKSQIDSNQSRISHPSQFGKHPFESIEHSDLGHNNNNNSHHNMSSDSPYNHSSETPFNQVYHSNSMRPLPGIPAISTTQHFGMPYYGHTLPPPPMPSHITTPSNYNMNNSGQLPSIAHSSNSFPVTQPQHLAVKGVSSMFRQLGHEKPTNAGPNSQPNIHSFKASSLAISSDHSNHHFQSYLGNTNVHHDSCSENQSQDVKDNSVNNHSATYHHEPYESMIAHQYQPTAPNNQPPSRQRSTSASMVTNNYPNHSAPARHTDSYPAHNGGGSLVDSQNNQWYHLAHNHQANNCTPRTNHNMINTSNDSHHYGASQNYCGSQQYDSDHASPQKIQNHSTDSSSSCYSTAKLNCSTSSLFTNLHENDDSLRTQTRSGSITITVNSDCHDVASWFVANRFTLYSKTFNNFCGSDLLRLSKNDLIEICGLIDGIRLYNNLHNQPIKPKRVLYISYRDSDVFNPIYLFDVTLGELMKELTVIFRSHFSSHKNAHIDEKRKNDKTSTSGANGDSRSSLAQSASESTGELCGQQGHCLTVSESQRRKGLTPGRRTSNLSPLTQSYSIDRLLVEGLTSVKVLATEQVVQLLDNESLWELCVTDHSGQTEACLKACHPKRSTK